MSQTMQLGETDIYGNTPLHLASQYGNISCINLLINDDTVTGLINYANLDKQTALHVAVTNRQM